MDLLLDKLQIIVAENLLEFLIGMLIKLILIIMIMNFLQLDVILIIWMIKIEKTHLKVHILFIKNVFMEDLQMKIFLKYCLLFRDVVL